MLRSAENKDEKYFWALTWKVFSILSLFFITLQSYYFYQFGVSIFPVIGALILFFLGLLSLSQNKVFSFILFFLVCIFFFIFYVVFSIFGYGDYKKVLAFFVIFVSMFGFLTLFFDGYHFLGRALSVALVVHLLFYFFQIFYWFLTGEFFDFLYPITGEMQRYHSLKGADFGFGLIPRFTGLFNEPGTFSTYIFIVIGLRALIKDNYDWLYYFGAFSVAINFSLYGIVFSVFLFLMPFFVKKEGGL